MKKVLTIAGSDCSGGAGIQADLKTMMAHGVYGMSVITALTAQNTMGVTGIMDVEPAFVASQIDAIFTDIYPDAVKIGMVSNTDILHILAKKLKEYPVKHVIIDPVMVSTSGSRLLSEEAVQALITKLLPLGTMITPNISEAEVLWGSPIKNQEDMVKAAEAIYKTINTAVLIKGGHLVDCADDLLYDNGCTYWYQGQRIANKNTHGTGCTLSSAIASNMALGYEKEESVKRGKCYIEGALRAGLDLGNGSGPLQHNFGNLREFV